MTKNELAFLSDCNIKEPVISQVYIFVDKKPYLGHTKDLLEGDIYLLRHSPIFDNSIASFEAELAYKKKYGIERPVSFGGILPKKDIPHISTIRSGKDD